jgi:hypothetical protein
MIRCGVCIAIVDGAYERPLDAAAGRALDSGGGGGGGSGGCIEWPPVGGTHRRKCSKCGSVVADGVGESRPRRHLQSSRRFLRLLKLCDEDAVELHLHLFQ